MHIGWERSAYDMTWVLMKERVYKLELCGRLGATVFISGGLTHPGNSVKAVTKLVGL